MNVEQPRLPTKPILIEEIEITATGASLEGLYAALDRLWLRGEAQMPSFPDQRWRFEFATAVAEIVANILRHAYPAGVAPETRAARLTLALLRDRVEAVLTDRGVAIDGDLAGLTPEPEPGVLAEGGWGLAIAQALLDELTYERRPDGTNRWYLRKRFSV